MMSLLSPLSHQASIKTNSRGASNTVLTSLYLVHCELRCAVQKRGGCLESDNRKRFITLDFIFLMSKGRKRELYREENSAIKGKVLAEF